MSSGYYSYGSGTDFFPLTPDESPQSGHTTPYHTSSSEHSSSSHRSTRVPTGGRVYIVDKHGRAIETYEGTRPRRRTTSTPVIIQGEEPRIVLKPITHTHRRGGSHSSTHSHSSTNAPPTLEPESIYIENPAEQDERLTRRVIVDNRRKSRSHQKTASSDDGVAERRSRSKHRRTAARDDFSPEPVQRVMSWSDDEIVTSSTSRPRSRSRSLARKPSIKRGPSTRRKSVVISDDVEVISPQDMVEHIRMENEEIKRRPAVPDPYYRPRVETKVYDPAQAERQRRKREQRDQEDLEDRLRRRQELPPIVTSEPHHQRRSRRRDSIATATTTTPNIVLTAPPIFHYAAAQPIPRSPHRYHHTPEYTR